MNAVMLNLETLPLSDEQFYQLCQGNPEKQLEMTAAGELVMMALVGGESGRQEADLITDVNIWNLVSLQSRTRRLHHISHKISQ